MALGRKQRVIATAALGTAALGGVAAGWFMLAGTPPAPTIADLRYGSNPAQTFDVWRPDGSGPFPVVLAVHGGGFAFGDKRGRDGLAPDIAALRAQGIAVASANYRMSGEALFPAAAQDVTSALAELRRQAPSLGLDPDRIALWGKSAGANLVLLAGLSQGRAPIGNGVQPPVSAIIAMYPPVRFDVMDAQLRRSACGESAAVHDAADSFESKWLGGALQQRRDLVAQASPLSYVSSSAPPVLVQAGSADCMVPPAQSVMLAEALRRAGGHVRLDILPGAKHIDPKFDERANLTRVVFFLKDTFKAQKSTALGNSRR